MGRIAGVSAADTRARLLEAAAEVFATQGYAGTRVSDIATAAGVSNSALYAHFDSKAELLVAALQAHGRQRLAGMFTTNPDRSMAELFVELGSGLPRQQDARGSLVVQALVAARRDPDVAALMRSHLDERVRWLSDMVRIAQADGEVNGDVSPRAVGQFSMLLALGSALAPADLIDVDPDEWTALINRLVTALGPDVPKSAPSTTTTESRTP
jgi:AcrR family transcriptional regulator